MSRTLADLLGPGPVEWRRGDPAARVAGIHADSRRVVPGSVFVALRGPDVDGHQFLADAAERGAAAVVGEDASTLDACPVNVVAVVPDARLALGRMLGVWYDRPDRHLEVLAVTGTNGKTTVAHLLRDLWTSRGRACGLLGTIQWDSLDESRPARLTTPGAEDLVALLARIRDAGGAAVAMEASSHALDQQRLAGVEVDFALFTNLTRDHLDYHQDFDAYLEAKLRLRDRTAGAGRSKPVGRCIVNADDPRFGAVRWPDGTVRVGQSAEATIRGLRSRFDRNGTVLELDFAGEEIELSTRLLGQYNAENLLLVAGAAWASGMSGPELVAHASSLNPVPGRLEPVEVEGGPLCVVDYAHTPAGLDSALSAVRALTGGRVHLVFGCGGDRDRGKRPQMAASAAAGADRIYFTLDNPRTEDPEQIYADTEPGFGNALSRVRRIDDRAEAIGVAVEEADGEDVVLVAGKGHETYQIIGDEKLPWDDRACVRTAASGGQQR